MQFIISTTDEVLVPQAGLGLVGALLQDTKLRRRVDAIEVEGCLRPKVKHGDVVTAAIGLLCLGKTDFTDIEPFREDEFFRQALAAKLVRHANRWKLAFWRNSPWGTVWRGLYGRFCGSPYVRSG